MNINNSININFHVQFINSLYKVYLFISRYKAEKVLKPKVDHTFFVFVLYLVLYL